MAAAVGGDGGAAEFSPHAFSVDEVERVLSAEKSDSQGPLLLIDARPYSDYLVSHISGALSVRLSSLMTRRLSKGTNKLYDLVIQEQKEQYQQIYSQPASRVVVYDSASSADTMSEYNSKNPLHVILKALCAAGDKEYGFLIGGFTGFKDKYPHSTRSPDVVVNSDIPNFPSLAPIDEPLSAALMSAGPSPSPFWTGESESARARKILNIAPSVIEPYMLIGSKRDAADRKSLRDLGVTHVLNATPDCPCHFEDELTYLRLPIKDCWNQNLPSHFPAAFKFIDSAKRSAGGRVMIHCTAGISRSAAISIAYLMSTKSLRLTDAYAYVKSKRAVISPNLDFMGELQQFERTLSITPTPPLSEGGPETPMDASLGEGDAHTTPAFVLAPAPLG